MAHVKRAPRRPPEVPASALLRARLRNESGPISSSVDIVPSVQQSTPSDVAPSAPSIPNNSIATVNGNMRKENLQVDSSSRHTPASATKDFSLSLNDQLKSEITSSEMNLVSPRLLSPRSPLQPARGSRLAIIRDKLASNGLLDATPAIREIHSTASKSLRQTRSAVQSNPLLDGSHKVNNSPADSNPLPGADKLIMIEDKTEIPLSQLPAKEKAFSTETTWPKSFPDLPPVPRNLLDSNLSNGSQNNGNSEKNESSSYSQGTNSTSTVETISSLDYNTVGRTSSAHLPVTGSFDTYADNPRFFKSAPLSQSIPDEVNSSLAHIDTGDAPLSKHTRHKSNTTDTRAKLTSAPTPRKRGESAAPPVSPRKDNMLSHSTQETRLRAKSKLEGEKGHRTDGEASGRAVPLSSDEESQDQSVDKRKRRMQQWSNITSPLRNGKEGVQSITKGKFKVSADHSSHERGSSDHSNEDGFQDPKKMGMSGAFRLSIEGRNLSDGPPTATEDEVSRSKFIHAMNHESGYFKEALHPIVKETQAIFYVPPTDDVLDTTSIYQYEDIYEQFFFSHVHWNFLGKHHRKEEAVVASVLHTPAAKSFRCLLTTKRNAEEFFIRQSELETSKKAFLLERLEEILHEHFQDYSFHAVARSSFPMSVRNIERQFPQEIDAIKIAVIYSNGTEKTVKDLFNHPESIVSSAFIQFLNLLGRRIQLKGWKRYRGDLGTEKEGKSYYCEWNGVEIMLHIAMWMDAEQHRRLLGNDVTYIVFHEEGAGSFDPTPLDSLGTVPQVFCVVQPQGPRYRIGYFSRPNIKDFKPAIPTRYSFTNVDMKNFLFTKVFSGYAQAMRCPPMNRLFEVPRAAYILDLWVKFPRETPKETKNRLREEKARRKTQRELASTLPARTFISITVIKARSIFSSDPNSVPDALVAVEIGSERKKTQVRKQMWNPEWNEELIFDAAGIEPRFDYVRVQILDNRKSHEISYMGEVLFSFADISEKMSQDIWFPLQNERTGNGSQVLGEICLQVKVTGPNSSCCPKCRLYIGEAAMLLHKKARYHATCVVCERCHLPLKEREYMEKDNLFYCHKDYQRVFGSEKFNDQLQSSLSGLFVPVLAFLSNCCLNYLICCGLSLLRTPENLTYLSRRALWIRNCSIF